MKREIDIATIGALQAQVFNLTTEADAYNDQYSKPADGSKHKPVAIRMQMANKLQSIVDQMTAELESSAPGYRVLQPGEILQAEDRCDAPTVVHPYSEIGKPVQEKSNFSYSRAIGTPGFRLLWPEEIIRFGDEFEGTTNVWWRCHHCVGTRVKDHPGLVRRATPEPFLVDGPLCSGHQEPAPTLYRFLVEGEKIEKGDEFFRSATCQWELVNFDADRSPLFKVNVGRYRRRATI